MAKDKEYAAYVLAQNKSGVMTAEDRKHVAVVDVHASPERHAMLVRSQGYCLFACGRDVYFAEWNGKPTPTGLTLDQVDPDLIVTLKAYRYVDPSELFATGEFAPISADRLLKLSPWYT